MECGDAREVHDFATLLGFGADGVCPYLAYEALARMNSNGTVYARSNQTFSDEELFYSYRKAAAKGLLKVMSKMGISTLQSYKGAQVFEALGLDDDVMERWVIPSTPHKPSCYLVHPFAQPGVSLARRLASKAPVSRR